MDPLIPVYVTFLIPFLFPESLCLASRNGPHLLLKMLVFVFNALCYSLLDILYHLRRCFPFKYSILVHFCFLAIDTGSHRPRKGFSFLEVEFQIQIRKFFLSHFSFRFHLGFCFPAVLWGTFRCNLCRARIFHYRELEVWWVRATRKILFHSNVGRQHAFSSDATERGIPAFLAHQGAQFPDTVEITAP